MSDGEIERVRAAMDRAFDAIEFDPPNPDSGQILNPPGLTVEKLTDDYAGFLEGRDEIEYPCWAPLMRGWRKRLAENWPPPDPGEPNPGDCSSTP